MTDDYKSRLLSARSALKAILSARDPEARFASWVTQNANDELKKQIASLAGMPLKARALSAVCYKWNVFPVDV